MPVISRPLICSLTLFSTLLELAPGQVLGQSPNASAERITLNGQCLLRSDRTTVVPHAHLKLWTIEGLTLTPSLIAETDCDENGIFTFENLVPPTEDHFTQLKYVVVAQAKGKPVAYGMLFNHLDQANFRLYFHEKTGVLRGQVKDEHGNRLENATIAINTYAVLPGVPQVTTKTDGLYLLSGIPGFEGEKAGIISLRVSHPDYPILQLSHRKSPDLLNITMKSGCEVTGSVKNSETGESIPNMVITARQVKSSSGQSISFRTGENGRFRIVVEPGLYNFVLDDSEFVAPALNDVYCKKNDHLELDPILAERGGWIVGQVVNTGTGKSQSHADEGHRIALGHFSPGRPKGNIINTDYLCRVDDDGRFRMRALPGEVFPYLCNIRGERNTFTTEKFPAVKVVSGQETEVVMRIIPEKTPDQKMEAAIMVLDSLPKKVPDRVEAIIAEFRKLNHTVAETEIWCALIQDLVKIGKPAVLPLCAELESTNEQRMLRRLGFALRAIGDPRAVPALIRALPKTLQPPMSDYGLNVDDANLLQFMQQNDLSQRDRGQHFSFGRPVREVHEALNKLTNRRVDVTELASIKQSEDRRAQAKAEAFYHATATDWALWWEGNWREIGVDEQFSKVNLPEYSPPDLSSLPTGLTLTENSKIAYAGSGYTLSPVGDLDEHANYFIDLDMVKKMKWPAELPLRENSPEAIDAATRWAQEHGVDLMCIALHDKKNNPVYTLVGVEMQLWEISAESALEIEKLVVNGALPTGREVEKYLQHEDLSKKTTLSTPGSSFLYVTSEQGLGMITVTDLILTAKDITGAFGVPKGVGFHRGVKFDIRTIAR